MAYIVGKACTEWKGIGLTIAISKGQFRLLTVNSENSTRVIRMRTRTFPDSVAKHPTQSVQRAHHASDHAVTYPLTARSLTP